MGVTMENLTAIFEQVFGTKPHTIVPLPMAGSNRKYYRMKADNTSAIGVVGVSCDENRAFCLLCAHFRERGIAVPQLYAYSHDYAYYLQEDLGDESLFGLLQRSQGAPWSEELRSLLEQTMRALPQIQYEGGRGLDFAACYPQSSFDARTIMWDLNYFKYNFLKVATENFLEGALEDDFERFAQLLLEDSDGDTFLYRDFQSRNVMVKDGKPYFIDFQGGRRGPVQYDVASFLWQAKANYSVDEREHLLSCYLESLRKYTTVDEQAFRARLNYFVLFRTLQVLGAYGFRGFLERKAHFLESIPYAIANLRSLLGQIDATAIPYLYGLLQRIVDDERFAFPRQSSAQGLTVRIFSFSYKRGIPDDFSGNGGGYVFDCRGVHNPGRYDAYKPLTGMDKPVIEFLEHNGEITTFLQSVYALADAHVARYVERGFKHLMFSFGCTGGQHRSVYAAQHLAEYLAKHYPTIRVELTHREQHCAFVFEGGECNKSL